MMTSHDIFIGNLNSLLIKIRTVILLQFFVSLISVARVALISRIVVKFSITFTFCIKLTKI